MGIEASFKFGATISTQFCVMAAQRAGFLIFFVLCLFDLGDSMRNLPGSCKCTFFSTWSAALLARSLDSGTRRGRLCVPSRAIQRVFFSDCRFGASAHSRVF